MNANDSTATAEPNDEDVTEHRIEGTDDLLMMTIKDQASDLEHGWREGIQNGIDKPSSSEVCLDFNEERTVIRDDGDVLDLNKEEGRKLLTNLGESSKDRDDDTTIGQFGVGKGQVNAKGRASWISGDRALHFNVEEWGLTVKETSAAGAPDVLREFDENWAYYVSQELDGRDYVDGFLIVLDHYEDEVPSSNWKWNNYRDRIEKRFRFASLTTGTRVKINGDIISGAKPGDAVATHRTSHVERFQTPNTGQVHIAVSHGGNDPLEVYSRGIYVKDVDTRGLSGVIITERNLDLNFARNEIKSGCQLWEEISERLNEIRMDLFSRIDAGKLVSEAREAIASEMFEDELVRQQFRDTQIFKKSNGGRVSLDEITDRDKVGEARSHSKAADKLTEAWGMMILSENDDANQVLFDNWYTLDRMPERFDAEEFAEDKGLFSKNKLMDDRQVSGRDEDKLAIARLLADEMGIDRDIQWGKSDTANAWTDGHSEIVLTSSAASSRRWVQWVPELFHTLVHEAAHDGDTSDGCPDHGRRFNENYREMLESNEGALKDVLGTIDSERLSTVVTMAKKEYSDEFDPFEEE